MRGGTYTGFFTSKITGTAPARIVVRNYNGERATLDSADVTLADGRGAPEVLDIARDAHFADYWGLEITNSSAAKDCPITYAPNQTPPVNCGAGVVIGGSDNRLINLVVHDTGRTCIGSEQSDQNSGIFGAVVYNCGQGDGHGIYSRNTGGTDAAGTPLLKHIAGNIVDDQAGYSIQIYGATAPLRGFRVTDNVLINDGFLAGGKDVSDRGGDSYLEDIQFTGNQVYNAPVQFGYHNQYNKDVLIAGNTFVNPKTNVSALQVKWVADATITGNTFANAGKVALPFINFIFPAAVTSLNAYTIRGNAFYGPRLTAAGTGGAPIAVVQGATPADTTRLAAPDLRASGIDPTATFAPPPTSTRTLLLPNAFDPARWTLVVYNWPLSSTVPVDLSALHLKPGAHLTVRNALDPYAPDQGFTIVYDGGPLALPMDRWTMAAPLSARKRDTYADSSPFPAFGVFLVTTP